MYRWVVAPKRTLTLSTYSISSITSLGSIKSVSHPPKLVVKLNLPSEKAPAPPKPHMVPQVSQWMHSRTRPSTMGQRRV